MALLQVLATLSILLADEEDQTLKRDSHAQRWIDVASAARHQKFHASHVPTHPEAFP